MKTILLMMVSLGLAACNATSTSSTPTEKSVATASEQTTNVNAGYEIKVKRNGLEVATFGNKGTRPAALLDEGTLTIMLGSPDNKHTLTIDLKAAKAGTYPLAADGKAAQPGEVRIDLLTEATMESLIATKGEFKLSEYDGKTCSGAFNVTGADIKGAPFSIEGSFTKMGVRTAAGK